MQLEQEMDHGDASLDVSGFAAASDGAGAAIGIAAIGRPVRASFRNWPSWAFYAPVAGRALWRGALYGDFSLPTIANPLANGDGRVVSSSKSSVFDSLGPEVRGWVAPYVTVMRRAGASAASTVCQALSDLRRAGLTFPLVAKPDRGSGGKGVCLIAGEGELQDYVLAFPPGQAFLLQKLLDFPHEAGIMYARLPSSERGSIVALALKEPAAVIGDGVTTLRRLVAGHPHARHLRSHVMAEQRNRLDAVPARGERIELTFARNRSGGAVCLDARDLITPQLTESIDRIARSIPCFHVGRFDVRFRSFERLRAGEEFGILEINCGASEPLQAWDPENSVFQAWRAYFDQVDLLYAVGAANRRRGHSTRGTLGFLRGLWRQRRQMRAYPVSVARR